MSLRRSTFNNLKDKAMFYVPTDIWMMIVPIAIIWLLIQASKGIGNVFSDGSSLPEGVQRIRLHNMSDSMFRSRVLWAHHLREYNQYTAQVRCDILKGEEYLEANSKEELEDKVDKVFELFNQEYKAWRKSMIYGK